jgi:1-acyl-sn-glycerol-3-phosphate acyltransferase
VKPLDYFYDTPSWGEGRFPQRFNAFFNILVKLVFTPLFRYKAADSEIVQMLPAGKGAIIAPNHRSYLDGVFILSVLKPRPVRFMGKEEFFQVNPVLSRFAAWVGAYPVNRGTADMKAVKRSIRMLKRGELVGIFPEGTRIRREGQEVTYHEGVALIAAMADAPVIPVRIWGSERISPVGKRFFRPSKVSMRFGQPMYITDPPFDTMPKEQRYPAFTEAVMQSLYKLEPLPGTPEGRAAANAEPLPGTPEGQAAANTEPLEADS